MTVVIAALLLLILFTLWRLISHVVHLQKQLYGLGVSLAPGIAKRVQAALNSTLSADDEEFESDVDLVQSIGQIAADSRIIKRRMTYVGLTCRSVRAIENMLEKRWGMESGKLDPDVCLPWDRLQSLRGISREMPLGESKEREMRDLKDFVWECRRSADEDEFDTALES